MPAINTTKKPVTAKSNDRTPAKTPTIPATEIVDAAAEKARMQVASPFTAKAIDFANAFSSEEVTAFIDEDLDREEQRSRSSLHFMIHLANTDKKKFDAMPRYDALFGKSNNPRFYNYEAQGKDGTTSIKEDGDLFKDIAYQLPSAHPILEELSEIQADETMNSTAKVSRRATLNARLKRINTLLREAITLRDVMSDIKAIDGVDCAFQTEEDGDVLATMTPMVIWSTKVTPPTVTPMKLSKFIGLGASNENEPSTVAKAKASDNPYAVLTGAGKRDRKAQLSKFTIKNLNAFELSVFAWHSFLAPLRQHPIDNRFVSAVANRLKSKGGASALAALNEIYDDLTAILTEDSVAKALVNATKEEDKAA